VRCLMPNGAIFAVSYADLVRRGSRFAAALTAFGAGAGEIVIVILPHSPDLFCAFFGAVLGGQVPTILAPPSFKLNAEHYRVELEALLRRIDAKAVVTDASTAAVLKAGNQRLGEAPLLLVDDLTPERRPIPDASPAADDLALLQHSSGSTGLKKGVALTNRAVLRQIECYAPTLRLGPQDGIVSWLPLYHDMGLIACTILPAVTGVPVTAISPLQWGDAAGCHAAGDLGLPLYAGLDAELRIRVPGAARSAFAAHQRAPGQHARLDQLRRADDRPVSPALPGNVRAPGGQGRVSLDLLRDGGNGVRGCRSPRMSTRRGSRGWPASRFGRAESRFRRAARGSRPWK
jgi:hypothetical protein